MNVVSQLRGVALVVNQCGIIIQGEAGSGKSELALALLDRQHFFISDDSVRVDSNMAMTAPVAMKNHLYVREIGLMDVRQHYPQQIIDHSHTLQLVIRLTEHSSPINEQLGPQQTTLQLHSKSIPCFDLNRFSTINLALKVETLIKQYTLISQGLDAGPALLDRQTK